MSKQTQEDDAIVYVIDGERYPLKSFSLGEIEWLEAELGASMFEINPYAMTTLIYITAMVKRRTDPDFTADDARALTLDVLTVDDDDGEPDPPKVATVKDAAAKRAARKPKAAKAA